MTTKARHTPGKWTVNTSKTDCRIMVMHPDGERLIALMDVGYLSGCGEISQAERRANCQLCAAAPNLLAACRWAREVLNTAAGLSALMCLEDERSRRNDLNMLNAAIRAAEGEV